MNAVIEKVRSYKKVNNFLLFLASQLIIALTYNMFLLPLNIVAGGSNGIATITNYLYNIDPATMIFFISLACVILSFMYLGIEKTVCTIAAAIIYPILVKLTSPISNYLILDSTDMFIVVIFSGVLTGLANGLMFKTGYSSTGVPVICQILKEHLNIPVAKSSLVLNLSIVLVGAFFFGATNTMYAVILLYINSLVLDKVLLGISNKKAFYIVTKKEKEVKDYVINVLNHSVTIFDVKGGFLGNKKDVLLTVIPSREYYRITEGIKMIDKDVFFVVTDAYEVNGGK